MSLRFRTGRLAAAISVLCLTALSGCAVNTPEPVAEQKLGCMISAPAGFEDHSAGALTLAETDLARSAGIFSSTSSQRVSDAGATSAALNRMDDQDCALTMVIGPGGATELGEHASGNPDEVYLGISSGRADLPENVLSIDFDLIEPAFISGYIAATASETGKVGVVVSKGFPQSKELLKAFDAGVDLYNKEHNEETDEDVTSYRDGAVQVRTINDSEDTGREYLETARDADVDVLVPFGSAAAMGVVNSATEIRGGAKTEPPPENPDEATPLPKIIWYGASGGFSDAVIASIEPNIRGGLRTIFPDWPQSKNPDEEVAPETESPSELGGFTVTARQWEGTVENGGVFITAEDGFLSIVSDAGRSIADLRERIKSGEIDPRK